jgi:hypothetical protein
LWELIAVVAIELIAAAAGIHWAGGRFVLNVSFEQWNAAEKADFIEGKFN